MLYPAYDSRPLHLPDDPERLARIDADHDALPERAEIEALSELRALAGDDPDSACLAGFLHDGALPPPLGPEIDLYLLPLTSARGHGLAVSIRRSGRNGGHVMYHGVFPTTPLAQIHRVTETDRQLQQPIWELPA